MKLLAAPPRPHLHPLTRTGPRLALATVLVSLLAAAALLLAPGASRAQSAADALLGCFRSLDGLVVKIDRQGGQFGFTMGTGKRYVLTPALGDDERVVAEELGLDRFPGVTIVAGHSDKFQDTIFVVLSSALHWRGQYTQIVMFNYDFGLDPLFRVSCS